MVTRVMLEQKRERARAINDIALVEEEKRRRERDRVCLSVIKRGGIKGY